MYRHRHNTLQTSSCLWSHRLSAFLPSICFERLDFRFDSLTLFLIITMKELVIDYIYVHRFSTVMKYTSHCPDNKAENTRVRKRAYFWMIIIWIIILRPLILVSSSCHRHRRHAKLIKKCFSGLPQLPPDLLIWLILFVTSLFPSIL